MIYARPGEPGSLVTLKPRYDNFIGGHRVPPAQGQYADNLSPVNGRPFCQVARSTPEDIETALDAAHAAKAAWATTSLTECARVSPSNAAIAYPASRTVPLERCSSLTCSPASDNGALPRT